jgi:hypothetical protein
MNFGHRVDLFWGVTSGARTCCKAETYITGPTFVRFADESLTSPGRSLLWVPDRYASTYPWRAFDGLTSEVWFRLTIEKERWSL